MCQSHVFRPDQVVISFFQMYIIFPLYIMIFSISICGVIYEIIPVNVKIVKIFKDKNGKEESADPVDSGTANK